MILDEDDLARCQEIAEMDNKDIRPYVNAVADAVCIQAWKLYGREKTAKIAAARQLVYYLAHRGGMSYAAIGRAMRRDHTTVMHGVQREYSRRYPQGNPQLQTSENEVAIGD